MLHSTLLYHFYASFQHAALHNPYMPQFYQGEMPVRYKHLLCLCVAVMLGTAISGCTTYTWPDGSRETVIGVPAEDENARYEDTQAEATRHRTPGEIPNAERR